MILIGESWPRRLGRLAESRKPDSRHGKMEEPHKEKKNRNDGMGETNERVEEGGPQAVTELSTINGEYTAPSMGRLQLRWQNGLGAETNMKGRSIR